MFGRMPPLEEHLEGALRRIAPHHLLASSTRALAIVRVCPLCLGELGCALCAWVCLDAVCALWCALAVCARCCALALVCPRLMCPRLCALVCPCALWCALAICHLGSLASPITLSLVTSLWEHPSLEAPLARSVPPWVHPSLILGPSLKDQQSALSVKENTTSRFIPFGSICDQRAIIPTRAHPIRVHPDRG